MLSADQITALQDSAQVLVEPVVEWLISDIAERISAAGQFTSTASYEIWRAQNLGLSLEDIKKQLQKKLNITAGELEQLLRQAAEVGYNFDLSRLPTTNAIPFAENTSLQQIVDAAVRMVGEDLTNLTRTAGFVCPDGKPRPLYDAYRNACDFAFQKTVTGAQDYISAIRDATRGLAEKGVISIEYNSGKRYTLEAAVRRSVVGGMGLIVEEVNRQNFDALGCNGWEISAHSASAPDHEPIQGKQYPDAEYQRLNNSLKRRIGTLNCGHDAFPIILGVNSPQYTPAELEEMRQENEKGITYGGKHYTLYEATQVQRKLERSIRRQKHRILVDEALQDTDKLQTDQIKYQMLTQEYKRFSKATGQRMQYERMEVAGFTGKHGKAAEQVKLKSRATTNFMDNKAGSDSVSEQFGVNERTIESINKRGTKNLIAAYDRRRTHFGLNVVSGEDILSNPSNSFVEDYTGISVDTADVFESTIAKLSEKYYTGLTRVEVGDPKKFFGSGVFASVTPMPTVGANTLTLNPLKTKDFSALTQRIKELSEKGFCVKISDEHLGEYVATHEFAHTLINMKVDSYKNYVGIDVDFFKNVKKKIENIYAEYIMDIGNLDARRKTVEGQFFLANNQSELVKIQKEFSLIKTELESKRISKYSLENADEFMAECFVDCIIGENPSVYSKKVMAILDESFGRK